MTPLTDKLKEIAESEGREWWIYNEIYKNTMFAEVHPCNMNKNYWEEFHVTDSAHAEKLRSALKLAIEVIERQDQALEFYAHCLHFRKEKIRGKIIEYDVDVDAGPLYDIYEEVLPTEERGERARQTRQEVKEMLRGSE